MSGNQYIDLKIVLGHFICHLNQSPHESGSLCLILYTRLRIVEYLIEYELLFELSVITEGGKVLRQQIKEHTVAKGIIFFLIRLSESTASVTTEGDNNKIRALSEGAASQQ